MIIFRFIVFLRCQWCHSDTYMLYFQSSTDNRYEECLKIIWEEATQTGRNNSIRKELKRIINLQDTLRNTALHYATQLWTQEVVRYVLELGANIGIKNEYDEVLK